MKTIKNDKNFVSVKMMLEIRDKISSETQNMTFDELKAYIKLRIEEYKLKPTNK